MHMQIVLQSAIIKQFLKPTPLGILASPSMANSPTETDSNPVDLLSNLPDALLVTILSFLPTHIAARTSLLSRRFRHLWEVSPSLALISRDLPKPQSDNFVSMAKRALLRRNPSHPLLSLHIEISRYGGQNAKAMVTSLLAKARSLDLRHLKVVVLRFSDILPFLPIIFTINSLRCLSLDRFHAWSIFKEFNFPSKNTLNCLRSLSLRLIWADPAKLNRFLSELCSLEDLHLNLNAIPGLSLSSQTIRKLKLIIAFNYQKGDNLGLSLPKLESLHLEVKENLRNLSHIHGEFPLLRKAVINLPKLHEKDVSAVARLMNCISHVEELSLHLKESSNVEYPIPILFKSGDVPEFLKLEHLNLTLCFHEHNLEAVTSMLYNCPALKSLNLVHEIPMFTGWARGRKRKDWGSMLPHNADGNYRYANFKNLHLEENCKEVIKLLRKRCSSKRQARSDFHGPAK